VIGSERRPIDLQGSLVLDLGRLVVRGEIEHVAEIERHCGRAGVSIPKERFDHRCRASELLDCRTPLAGSVERNCSIDHCIDDLDTGSVIGLAEEPQGFAEGSLGGGEAPRVEQHGSAAVFEVRT